MTSTVLELLGPPPLTIDEVAEYLRISKTSAYELVKPGEKGEPPKLNSSRVGNGGGAIRVNVFDLKAYMQASSSGACTPAVEEEPVKRTRAIPRRMGERGKKKVG